MLEKCNLHRAPSRSLHPRKIPEASSQKTLPFTDPRQQVPGQPQTKSLAAALPKFASYFFFFSLNEVCKTNFPQNRAQFPLKAAALTNL